MKWQILEDSKGKPTGVFIPMQDWAKLEKKINALEEAKYERPSKSQLIRELKEAFQELALIERGKMKARPIQELLNEL